jgi:hypothetical protein
LYMNTSTLHGNSPGAAAVPPTIRVCGNFTPQEHVEPEPDAAVVVGTGAVVVGAAVVVGDDEPATTEMVQTNRRVPELVPDTKPTLSWFPVDC